MTDNPAAGLALPDGVRVGREEDEPGYPFTLETDVWQVSFVVHPAPGNFFDEWPQALDKQWQLDAGVAAFLQIAPRVAEELVTAPGLPQVTRRNTWRNGQRLSTGYV